MPVSSDILETRLDPDVRLRALLLISSLLFLVFGIVLALQLPFAPWNRALIVIAWVVDVSRQMASLCAGMGRVVRLQLDNSGRIIATGPGGEAQNMTLLTGSVVSQRLAWLRLRFPDNRVYAELLCGDSARNPYWHRFQLIWHQSAREFARPI